ncbi:MAG: hypothetical protein ABL989_11800 [Gammaproteobacteria bacterium]
MTTVLREIYEVMGCFSTATHTEMCKDLLRQLRGEGRDNLARHFSDAQRENALFAQIETPFVPSNRPDGSLANVVTGLMKRLSPVVVRWDSATPYEFRFLHREVPHLRAQTNAEQINKGWIDYVAVRAGTPILGEIKRDSDQNSFYAFIQLLTYLSELATPNQIARTVRHQLFGEGVSASAAFDLHICLANFNDRGDKGPLIGLTKQLATAFKNRLDADYPEAAAFLGNVLCFSADVKDSKDGFAGISGRWIVPAN